MCLEHTEKTIVNGPDTLVSKLSNRVRQGASTQFRDFSTARQPESLSIDKRTHLILILFSQAPRAHNPQTERLFNSPGSSVTGFITGGKRVRTVSERIAMAPTSVPRELPKRIYRLAIFMAGPNELDVGVINATSTSVVTRSSAGKAPLAAI